MSDAPLTPCSVSIGKGESQNRRQWLCDAARYTALGGIGSLAGWLLYKQSAGHPRSGSTAGNCQNPAANCGQCSQAAACQLPQVWQIDPNRCIACGGCQTNCVLDLSAVKAVNCFALCGYCDICTGYFPTGDYVRNTGAENQLCPTGAITRKFIEKQAGVPYFEYTIDERLCIACGKCVVGCRLMNGSLYLQVRHDRCLNCNECSIGAACPAEAFRRVPASAPQLLHRAAQAAEEALARKQKQKRT
jgi:Na+-translocating ferredoxin:NAD+ oxidoreductase subunit B